MEKQTWVLTYTIELEVEPGVTPGYVRSILGGTVIQPPREAMDSDAPPVRVVGFEGPDVNRQDAGGGA